MKKIIIALMLVAGLSACKKEHDEYRYKVKFPNGTLVQFEKSIEHDYVDKRTGERMSDIPQPMTVIGNFWNETWHDHWYYVRWANGYEDMTGVDELQLQKWNGTLQK